MLRQPEERIIPKASFTSQVVRDHPWTSPLMHAHAPSGIHQDSNTAKDRLPLAVRDAAQAFQQVQAALTGAQAKAAKTCRIDARLAPQGRHFQARIICQGELTAPGGDRLRLLDGVVAIGEAVLDDIRCLRTIGQRDQVKVKPRQDSLDLDELSPVLGPDEEREAQGDPPQ